MSEVSSEFVYRGYWVNLSKGKVMGATLTTDTRTGAIVIALLAALSTLASNHFWNLITFTIHQIRADGRNAVGLYHQQQTLLRALPTPSELVASSMKLIFVWKGTSKDRSLVRSSIIQATIALLSFSGFLAASIFSSQAITASNIEVLVKSPYCGLIADEGRMPLRYEDIVRTASAQYVEECYQDGGHVPARCNIFVKPRFPLQILENGSCPFESSMCATPTVVIDSGLVSLNDAFGLNLHDKDQVKYRHRTDCSVISLENRTRIFNASDIPESILGRPVLPGEMAVGYEVGSLGAFSPALEDFLFLVSLVESNITKLYDVHGFAISADPEVEDSFGIIPELERKDADVILQFIKTNNVVYNNAVDGPIFSAHQPYEYATTVSSNAEAYQSDQHGAIIGCTQQYQYCISNSTVGERCSELSYWNGIEPHDLDIVQHANAVQLEVLRNLLVYSRATGFQEMKDLEASKNVRAGGVVVSLPSDQWIREIKRWGAIDWVTHQILLSDYAVGPKARHNDSQETYKYPPDSEGGKKLCGMQRMRKSGGFVNINVFALAFIITFSVVVTLLDLVILRFLIHWSKFRALLSPRVDRWIQDGIFQLQRRAYEARGEGQWKRLDQEIPITTFATELSDLSAETSSSPNWSPVSPISAEKTLSTATERLDVPSAPPSVLHPHTPSLRSRVSIVSIPTGHVNTHV